MKEVVSTSKAPAAIGPYSQAIISDGLIFTSGQIPLNPETGCLVEGGIREQAQQAFQNLKEVLAQAGSSLNDVVKVNVYLTHLEDFDVLNQVYGEQFSQPYPARSCVEVSALPKGALVEIEMIARK